MKGKPFAISPTTKYTAWRFGESNATDILDRVICRVTEKLARRLKIKPIEAAPLHANPLLDWSCQSFSVSRLQLIVAVNTPSLYSVIFPAIGLTNPLKFAARFMAELGNVLMRDGLADDRLHVILEEHDSVTFAKSLNRSVTGSMNNMAYLAEHHFFHGSSLADTCHRLNRTPFSSLKFVFPVKAFAQLSI